MQTYYQYFWVQQKNGKTVKAGTGLYYTDSITTPEVLENNIHAAAMTGFVKTPLLPLIIRGLTKIPRDLYDILNAKSPQIKLATVRSHK